MKWSALQKFIIWLHLGQKHTCTHSHKGPQCERQSQPTPETRVSRSASKWWLSTQSKNAEFYTSTHSCLIKLLFKLYFLCYWMIKCTISINITSEGFFHVYVFYWCVCVLSVFFVFFFFFFFLIYPSRVITLDRILFMTRFKTLVKWRRNMPVVAFATCL